MKIFKYREKIRAREELLQAANSRNEVHEFWIEMMQNKIEQLEKDLKDARRNQGTGFMAVSREFPADDIYADVKKRAVELMAPVLAKEAMSAMANALTVCPKPWDRGPAKIWAAEEVGGRMFDQRVCHIRLSLPALNHEFQVMG